MCKNKIEEAKNRFLNALIALKELSGTLEGATSFPQVQKSVLRVSKTITTESSYKFEYRLSNASQSELNHNDIRLDQSDYFYPIGVNLLVQEINPATNEPVGNPIPYAYPDKNAFGAAATPLFSVFSGNWSLESDGKSIFQAMPSDKLYKAPQVQSSADEHAESAGCFDCCPIYNNLMMSGNDSLIVNLQLGAPSDRSLLTGDKKYIITFELCGFLYRGEILSDKICQLAVA